MQWLGCGLNDVGVLNLGGDRGISQPWPDWVWCPASLLFSGYWREGSPFAGSKVVGGWGWHSPPSSAKFKNMWSCTSNTLLPWMPSWHVQGPLYLNTCLFMVQRSHWLKGLHTVHGQKSLTEVTIEIALCWCYNAEWSLSLAVSQKFSSGWRCGDGMCHTNGHVRCWGWWREWRRVGCGVVLSGK